MKKLILSFFCLGTMASAQILLTEDFEGLTFPPTGWTRTSVLVDRPWDFTNVNFTSPSVLETTFLINGTKSACIDWKAGNNTGILTSPSFSLAGASSPYLYFKVKVGWSYMIDQNAGNLKAQISTNGTTWVNLWDEDTEPGFTDNGDGDPDTDFYNTVSVSKSLSAYIGQTSVKIRFQYTGNDADAVSIDDVKVSAVMLATNDVIKDNPKISVFPNPTSDFFTIKSDSKISNISILDFTGRIVNVKLEGNKVDVRNLETGAYIITVETAKGKSTEKFIKK